MLNLTPAGSLYAHEGGTIPMIQTGSCKNDGCQYGYLYIKLKLEHIIPC